MARTYVQLAAKLQEEIHSFSPAKARQSINDAYIRLCEMHPWQHLLKRFTLQTEAEYSTGTIAIDTLTSAVTLTDGVWVVSWGTAPSSRRMAITGRDEPYDVSVFGSTTAATLADTYIGDTLTEGTYNLFRDTYPLPTDCGYTELMALYDPTNHAGDDGRLWFFPQPRFVRELMNDPLATGTPECFTIMQFTQEIPPRPTLRLYPAPDEVFAYHGWYFRRPSLMAVDGDYPDWPAKFDDMIWIQACIDHFGTEMFFSRRFYDHYKTRFAGLFRRMKQEMDGQTAMDKEIEGTRSDPRRRSLFGRAVGEGSVSW